MDSADITQVEHSLGFVGRFLNRFGKFDNQRLDARLRAVRAIGKAAAETRAWTEVLRRNVGQDDIDDRGPEISQLWNEAATEIARFDTALAQECLIKAYGWHTGKWNNPEYEIIPRRVEEVYAEAMRLIKDYESFLGKTIK